MLNFRCIHRVIGTLRINISRFAVILLYVLTYTCTSAQGRRQGVCLGGGGGKMSRYCCASPEKVA